MPQMGLDMKTKRALTNETTKRYRKAVRKVKTKILDEFVGNTVYYRKYALHILVASSCRPPDGDITVAPKPV
jgi:hypothetical protein